MLERVELISTEPTPQVSEYVVYPWLYPGRLTLMVGPSNVGKTTLTLDIIATVLRGDHLWGRFPCKPIERVLYFHAEHTLATLQEAAVNRGDIPMGCVQVIHEFGPLTSRLIEDGKPRFALVQEMLKHVAEWRPQLIVFEPISAFVGNSENDNAAVRTMVNIMASIGAASGAAVLTHHHLGKPRTGPDGRTLPPKEQGEARGAAAFEDAAECVVYLRGFYDKDAPRLKVETSKIKGFPVSPVLLGFDQDNLTYDYLPQPFAERDLIAIYNYRREHPDAGTRDIVEHFREAWKGTRTAKVVLMLKRAARVGLVPPTVEACD